MDYLSASEIATLWGISERSVRNYCAQGRIPGAFLVGKTWSIPANAVKPTRANAKNTRISPLLERLRNERLSKLKGGIYHRVQVELTYNSNHIEGSKLSLEQTRMIFETSTIGMEDEFLRVDDIVEAQNHFRATDYVIDNVEAPISEAMFKELHKILQSGTSNSQLEWFAVGDYKRLPNEVGNKSTTAPECVDQEIRKLNASYRSKSSHTLEEIVDFHVQFERIHPFQDGNGRVGRLVMFKECLANCIVPFIITSDMKAYYYRGLREWEHERGYLLDTCLAAQDKFKTALDYFRIEY